MITFQNVILRLQDYWGRHGCALLQPYDMEVGAGTSHTATFLRALGPEPWRAAYVQPSRRPKDGRPQQRIVFDALERAAEVGLGTGGGKAGVAVQPCLLVVVVRGAQCRRRRSKVANAEVR